MKATVVIGGGPAGCQCALWLTQLGYEVIIIEKSNYLGGLQRTSPYLNDWLVVLSLTGQQLADNIQTQIESKNIPVIYNSSIELINQISNGFEISVNGNIINTSSIVIATGVSPRSGILKNSANVIIGPGERIYIEDFVGKRVAILGGGDNAAENYAFISDKNPKLCHVYARTVKARPNLWRALNTSDVFLGECEVNQNLMTIIHDNKKREYDYFIVLYGWTSNIPDSLLPLSDKLLNESGFIIVNENRETRISGIYAAGEVTQYLHPCVATAMADGVVVAKSIEFKLENAMKNCR